jgi:hypothetical protein
MDEQGLQIFCEYVSSGVKVFLEYGSGSSTIYAAEHGVENIISIDSDPKWVSMIKEKIINFSCESYIEHCNIGEISSWGNPINNELINNFHEYSVMPWHIAKEKNLVPELILIDGRFRVACFLYSLICCQAGTKILFDDYLTRDFYHVVERFCKLSEMRGRMAVFIATKDFDIPEIVYYFSKYSIIKE